MSEDEEIIIKKAEPPWAKMLEISPFRGGHEDITIKIGEDFVLKPYVNKDKKFVGLILVKGYDKLHKLREYIDDGILEWND